MCILILTYLDPFLVAPPSEYNQNWQQTEGLLAESLNIEALLLPRHVEFWTSGASSDRRYVSDKQKLSGCPDVIVYMCAHGCQY